MFNIGVPEMIVILLVALLVFGPNKLPEIARSMGKFLHNFQQETNRALSDLKAGIEPATTGIFDEPDAGTADETPVASAAPAFAAPAATRRKTSTPAPKTRRKPSTAKKKSASTPARKRSAAKTAPKKKPSVKKNARR